MTVDPELRTLPHAVESPSLVEYTDQEPPARIRPSMFGMEFEGISL